MARCYSPKFQTGESVYIGCTVCQEWLNFSIFESWVLQQDHEGCSLDKDLLCQGNKIYSPATCIFVPQALNALLCDAAAIRGAFPLGVTFNKEKGKFMAQITRDNKRVYLGYFLTPLEAHQAWQLAKIAAIDAAVTNDPRIRAALDKRAAQLRDDHANGRITTKL